VKRYATMTSLVICCALLLTLAPLASGLGGWDDPAGGWDYFTDSFEDAAEWTHDNGNDAWDESAPGEAGTSPGGVSIGDVVPGEGDPSGDAIVLSMEDTGDPRNAGFADPSNRKIYLTRDLAVEGNIFEDGVTFIARWRINPDPIEGPADGYTLHDGGKGHVGIGHDGDMAGDGIQRHLSFSLDTGGLLYFANDTQPPLEIGDEFEFHTVWATAVMARDFAKVNVYVDGDTDPIFSDDIPLGDQTGGESANRVAVGMGSTGGDGSIQVDYIGYKAGVNPPTLQAAVSSAGKLSTVWGALKSK